MRARASLAMLLEKMGSYEKAIAHYEGLLALNPNDNQGIRYLLLSLYIEIESLDQALHLLDTYKEDIAATFMFNRALISLLTKGVTNEEYDLYVKANKQNT